MSDRSVPTVDVVDVPGSDRAVRSDNVDDNGDVALESTGGGSRSRRMVATRALPWVLVLCVATISLLRNDVAPGEIVRFAAYWSVTLVAPGFVVFRSLIPLRSPAETLIGSAATGLALEVSAWHLFRLLGLDQFVTWWWVAVLAPCVLVPGLRRRWLRRHSGSLPPWWHWAMAIVIGAAIVAIDVGGFRANPLPPSAGNVYVDMWWHLALVQELMRDGPAQVPQLAGEAINYHFNAHAHMAVGSASARIEPEVVLFRLWYLPIVAVTLGLVAVVARRLSGAVWSGPIAAWTTVGALAGGFIWQGSLGTFAGSPIVFASPSQMIANVFMVASLGLLVEIVRGHAGLAHLVLFGLVAWAGIGSKPTVGALLLAGLVSAALASMVIRRRFPDRLVVAAGVGLVAILGTALSSQNSEGSRLTILGSLRGVRVYDQLNPNRGIRAVNDGLLLDSLHSTRAVFAAAVAVIVLVGFHAIRLIGFGVLLRADTRRDLAGWLLAGTVLAGWGAFFVLDHVGYSQAYFVYTAVPAGALLTTWLLVSAVGTNSFAAATPVLLAGAGVGVLAHLLAVGAGDRVAARAGGGILEVVAVPILVVGAVMIGAALVWRRLRATGAVGSSGLAFSIALLLGLASAPALSTLAGRTIDFASSPEAAADPTAKGFVTEGELNAARWLRDNSAEDDVVATNLHCRPPANGPGLCDARGYWLSGQSGRRIVLEGWSYTSAALGMQGVGGRSFAIQPPPWPERYDLSQAAVVSPTAEVLDRLSSEYGASWVVAVRRADAVSPRLGELADLAFDNGEVAIYRLR